MRVTWIRIGLIAATFDVLVFIAMLTTRQPAYGRLAELDAYFHSGTTGDYSSAEPMYLAARPFYSLAHTAGVPLAESIFLFANVPAMLGALLVAEGVDEARSWFEAQPLSWTQRSWVMAVVLCSSPHRGRFWLARRATGSFAGPSAGGLFPRHRRERGL